MNIEMYISFQINVFLLLLFRCIHENPYTHSAWQSTALFLENPTDRGAWLVTVYMDAKSQARLNH